ncbi:MAG TPA: hypothetical protein PKV16_07880 [Caldisericia bacterium]|nr:hypothetical protein [Caldisericia bacterium]HPF49659.1 hypothetical protein [Caldisericia bacterium]HPI84642.1 hypothetical protein [Caldisericia bacterium]HPQ93683.1 hypothetical protein [Caldisericia bacterium]HRV74753.1 hypothetical protein [Caldisericia bacterium]
MRNVFLAVCLIIFLVIPPVLIGCESTDTPDIGWDQIHEMVDYGAFRSEIDEAIHRANPTTHEASRVVLEYFSFCSNGDYENAWNLIEEGSPFSELQPSLSDFESAWAEAKTLVSYGVPEIVGIEIYKENDGFRFVNVSFEINLNVHGEATVSKNIGKYTVSNKTGKWLLWSINAEEQ